MTAVCRRLEEERLISGRDGNVSMRLSGGRVLITPAGAAKATLHEEDLVEVSLDGAQLRGAHAPSTEMELHLATYRARPAVRGVVHAHPPHATAFATAGVALQISDGEGTSSTERAVPAVPFAPPGTRELAETFVSFLDGLGTALLSNHGAVTVGDSIEHACARMERLEVTARIALDAHILSRGRPRE